MSGLRITGGTLRGRVLRAPVQRGVRPTSSRVREALFDLIGHDLDGWRVLDAFGGSGLLAAEAASRGAQVVCAERSPRVAAALRDGLSALDVPVTVRVGDAAAVAAAEGPFDAILADPPYADDGEAWLRKLAPHARAVVVVEQDARARLPDRLPGWAGRGVRRYGGTALWVYDALAAAGEGDGDAAGDR